MRTYYSTNLEIRNISEEMYDKLIDFLEENNIDCETTNFQEYTIDERSEDEKYDDWLYTLADNQYEESKLNDDRQ